MVNRLVNVLRETGELKNTYLVFTSDNGYHMGQHRLVAGKGLPYEEDVRVPLIVRGPGVPQGRNLKHMVLNIDFAPPSHGWAEPALRPPRTGARSSPC
jgi:arylsulfatase A-like enzyme